MKRTLLLALIALPLLTSLGGCIIYDERGGYHRHYDWR